MVFVKVIHSRDKARVEKRGFNEEDIDYQPQQAANQEWSSVLEIGKVRLRKSSTYNLLSN